MGTTYTTHRSYPVPDLDAAANVPASLQAVAAAVDTDVNDLIGDLAALAALTPDRTYALPTSSTSWSATGLCKKTEYADGRVDLVYNIKVERETSSVTIEADAFTPMGVLIPAGFRRTGASPSAYIVGAVSTGAGVARSVIAYAATDGTLSIKAIGGPWSLGVGDVMWLTWSMVE